MTLTLEESKRKRSNIKRNMSRIKSIVDEERDRDYKAWQAELKCRLGIFEAYFKQALSVQADIEDLDPADTGRADLEDNYVAVKISIQAQLHDDMNSTMNHTETTSSAPVPAVSHLPRLSLPSFSGDYASYKNFITSFTQLIGQEPKLTNIEKFNYLLSCLTGSALETVKAFQVSSENYTKALERLKERFDNPTLIFLEGIASLFTLPSINQPNPHQIRSLIDQSAAIFSSLHSLGTGNHIAQAMLIYIVTNKCDQQTRNKWNESLDYKLLPTWSQCTQVLERHCQYLLSSESSLQSKPESGKYNSYAIKNQKSSFAITNTCVLCYNSNHKIISCPQFRAMNTHQRFDTTKRLDLCINCLSTGHRLAQCSSKHLCRACNRNHHTMLHHDNSFQATTTPLSETTPLQPSSSAQPSWSTEATSQSAQSSNIPQAATHSHMESSNDSHVILATAMVLVKDSTGAYKFGRALLDSCSQVNFITDDFAQKLRLRREKYHVGIRSIGESLTNIKARTTTTITSCTSSFTLSVQFGITSHIAYQPDSEIDTSSWNLPANRRLADEQFFKPRRIDLLLGTEAFFDALAVGQIRLGPKLPTLQKTLFGWVVSGRCSQQQYSAPPSCLLASESSIDDNLQHLWKLENVDHPAKLMLPEHTMCEKHFTATVQQDNHGRIVVELPFKDNSKNLGNSFEIARRRFFAMEKRLINSPEIRSQYISFMEEYESLGHMSIVSSPNLEEPHYYIPHHYVLKPTSISTKLRVVFDASSRTTTQISLNDLLMVGPTIQQELYLLLLRFRLYRYAISADVTKMYRQVLVNPNDRKYQYILWRVSPDSDLCTYQLNTVTYGTASAPYLAIRSLHYLADQYMDKYPIGASTIKSSFYVDDLLCGANDIATLKTLKSQVIEVLQNGNFPLSKWRSNHPDFMEIQSIKELNFTDEFITSALGVTWQQNLDTFLFTFAPKQVNTSVTKRKILSIASSLFDPLGLLSPLVITAKIILQELWLLKLDWDESVPQHLQHAWNNCLDSFSSVSSLTVPRYCLQPHFCNIQMHGFCDASIRAYGCCLYIRTEDSCGQVAVHLLTSKSRVAPVKKQSLPKLELCGAHLLAKLYDKVKPIFNNQPITTYFWTDSQLVLHWLKQYSATLSTFVGNRVSDIQDLTSDGQWRFVPTQENPADLVSRGCTIDELKSSTWVPGPPFLYENIIKWPQNKGQDELNMEAVNAEKRKQLFVAINTQNYILDIIDGISSYLHCLRLIAWMFRFHAKCRKISCSISPSLSPEELRQATNSIIWNLQQHHFHEEIRLLRKNQPLKSSLKSLTPFLHNSAGFELIKVGGRLDYADLPDSQKHPILLPSNSKFVLTYVRHLHLRNYHAGPKALVALIRNEYWLVNARNIARRIVRNCVHCVRYKPTLLQQVMGPLPAERLTPARPFQRCGVDFCGPINTYLRIRGKGPIKSYIYLAPHFGGLWEAAVKSAKGLLYRSLTNTRLTFEELSTVAVEIEAVLNSRPLSPLSSDPNDFGVLTAGHLLVGDSLRALSERSFEDKDISNLDRYNTITAIKQRFWRRWSEDYINELRARVKWTSPAPNLTEGTLVIIHEDNLPPQRWKLGRVESNLRTANGPCCRAIHKLAILPTS